MQFEFTAAGSGPHGTEDRGKKDNQEGRARESGWEPLHDVDFRLYHTQYESTLQTDRFSCPQGLLNLARKHCLWALPISGCPGQRPMEELVTVGHRLVE